MNLVCQKILSAPRHCLYNKLIPIEDNHTTIWDKVFKNGPNKICGRQPILEYFPPYVLLTSKNLPAQS